MADYGWEASRYVKLFKVQLVSVDKSLYITPQNCVKQFQSWEDSKYIIYKKFVILVFFIYL